MQAKDLIRAGKLTEARERLVEELRSAPGDAGKRTLLFQVLAFCGEWDKAERHLAAIVAQDPGTETGVQAYKNLAQGEKARLDVARENLRPSFLPKTPPYAELFFAAREKLFGKKIEEAADLLGQMKMQLPVASGKLNGKSFTGLKDTDTSLSPFLEAIVHERYVWIPFDALRELVISPPKTLFDLLWITSRITTWEGLTLNCFLPVLYPDSFLHEDEGVRLGRMTDWISWGRSYSKGMGQHVFQIGEEEIGILEIQEVQFSPPHTDRKNEESN